MQRSYKITDIEQIQTAVSVLMGKFFVDCGRALNMGIFSFASDPPESNTGAQLVDYALHVQCAWRVSSGNRIIVGHRDLFYAAGIVTSDENPPDFDWELSANRLDERIRFFMDHSKQPRLVTRVTVGRCGNLDIEFEREFHIEVFPNDSLQSEYWRLFRPKTKDEHVTIVGDAGEQQND